MWQFQVVLSKNFQRHLHDDIETVEIFFATIKSSLEAKILASTLSPRRELS